VTAKDLQFDGWTVNRVSGEISREGRSTRLPQQPLRILIELFDHAGQVVTREQLVKALWPSGIVDFDNGLNVAMRKLRVALDDVGDTPRYIETLPKVGYRFIVRPIADLPPPPAAARPRSRLWLAATLAALAAVLVSWWWFDRSSGPAVRKHIPSERAQELYLDALQQRSRRDVDGNALALERFEEALREDPDYAQAWATYGEVISSLVLRQRIPRAEGMPKARAAAKRALELDGEMAEGHMLAGQIAMDHDKDFAAAHRAFERASEIDPDSARLLHYYAMWHGQLGHLDEAMTAIRRAREIEPTRPLYAGNYGLLLYVARRYEEARAFLEPLIEANPKFDIGRSVLARTLMATGDLAGAARILEGGVEFGTGQGDLGAVYAKMGRRDDALREIARLDDMAARGFSTGYDKALIHVSLGELDQGCEMLARAVVDQSPLVNWMRLDPRLDPLRGRRCFKDAEAKLYQDMAR
jgi:DNA-binding winged helix-turn-helix (wHTH) protein/tetratricopeptide (TPR) repeat protein